VPARIILVTIKIYLVLIIVHCSLLFLGDSTSSVLYIAVAFQCGLW
jgi:hypothetical protein